jgi:tryptophanyl-tRNA synthetase
MKRVLTGIQSSGNPHLGNILGAITPAINLSRFPKNECFFFIADLHSLTTIKDAEIRKKNIQSVAAAWLAFGFDTQKQVLYRQSHILEVCELTWYLSCFMPYSKLQLAHSFKDKSSKLDDINSGLFTYPVLMCADILAYDAEIIPVGKDQKQHIEYAKDIARRINHFYDDNVFVIPEIQLDEKVMTIPGVDGQKMSKSYNNCIDVFQDKKNLKKEVYGIVTDSKSLEDSKRPEDCNVFRIYSAFADKESSLAMADKYKAGGFGYGAAKKELFDLLWVKFERERDIYNRYMNKTNEIDEILVSGEEKARAVAKKVLERFRIKLGFD